MICAFSCDNLLSIAKGFRERFPGSKIIIFGDNDRHLRENKGMVAGQKAIKAIGSNSLLACPEFGDIPPDREASDWNDLFRLRGREEALKQFSSLFRA